jgi:hypothetical protein
MSQTVPEPIIDESTYLGGDCELLEVSCNQQWQLT